MTGQCDCPFCPDPTHGGTRCNDPELHDITDPECSQHSRGERENEFARCEVCRPQELCSSCRGCGKPLPPTRLPVDCCSGACHVQVHGPGIPDDPARLRALLGDGSQRPDDRVPASSGRLSSAAESATTEEPR